MNIVFDFEKLKRLLASFYEITGLRYSAVDSEYNVVCASSSLSEFCSRIHALPEGYARCVESDTHEARSTSIHTSMRIYRCHAGVTEVAIPIIGEGQIVAYLFVGQVLNSAECIEEQWQSARRCLNWHPDRDLLEEPFKKLRIVSEQTLEACATILRACSAYIWLDGVVKTNALSDTQRVNAYVDANYTSKITLGSMAKALSMSKTKLCMLACKEQTTVMQMIRKRRIAAAKKYLENTEYTITEIADMVGISDYNYFTKVFKSMEGLTPRHYRKLAKTSKN